MNRFLIKENGNRFQTGDLLFFAAQSLKKGEELCISYGGRQCDLYIQNQVNIDDIIKNQAIRKQRVKDEYFFNCQCIRCVNEAMGKLDKSFMNLVKEHKCKKVEMLWLVHSILG